MPRFRNRPGSRALRALPSAAALAGACIGAATAQADEFFPTRDENPLLRGFYVPLPGDSRAGDGAVVAAAFSIMNTLNAEQRGTESLLVDGETDTLRLSYEDSLAAAWRYRITLPVIRDSGGFLDAVIDDWHRFFGFNRGNRPFYPRNQLVFFYSGGNRIDMTEPGTHLGDLSLDGAYYAVDTPEHTVSLWGGLKAPTGSVAHLTSDGAWDGALWAHGAVRWPLWQLGAEAGIRQPFGDEVFGGAAHVTSAFMRVAATRDLGPAWALRAQLSGQTRRVAGSDVRLLGPSLQLTVGAVHRVWGRWHIAFGFAEDAAVDTAPDVTFFLGVHD